MSDVNFKIQDNTQVVHARIQIFSAGGITVEIEHVEGGVNLIITDDKGEHVGFIADGKPGPQGKPGKDGEDAGFLTFDVDSTGDLYVTNTTGTNYAWTYDKETGDLYVSVDGAARVLVGNIIGPKGDKGDKGGKGEQGEKGDTPVRGVDYWTNADQTAIINGVLAELNNASEVGV